MADYPQYCTFLLLPNSMNSLYHFISGRKCSHLYVKRHTDLLERLRTNPRKTQIIPEAFLHDLSCGHVEKLLKSLNPQNPGNYCLPCQCKVCCTNSLSQLAYKAATYGCGVF